MNLIRLALSGLLVVLGLVVDAAAQRIPAPSQPEDLDRATASISGRIKLHTGRPVGLNIKVVLATVQAPLMTLYSDNNGEFNFTNLRGGIYYVRVLPDPKKYEPISEQVRLLPDNNPTLTFYLVEKRDPSSGKPRAPTVSAGEAASEIPPTAKEEFDEAHRLLTKKDVEGAIAHFERAIGIYPGYLIALNDLGVQYLKFRRLREAAEQFEAAIAKDSHYFNARMNLGIVRVEEKRFDLAIEQLNQAITIDGSHPGPHLFLGIASLAKDDLPTAEKELVKALVLGGPEYSKAHYYFAHVYLKSGRPKDAVRELKVFLETAPPDEMAAQARALIEELGRQ